MKEPKRILHVLGGLDQGGAETFVMSLYRAIDRHLIQFDFVVHTSDHCYYENEIERLGGVVYRIPRFTGFNIGKYIHAWNKFFREHSNFTAVHGHIGSSAAIYLCIAKKYNLPTVAHSHGTGYTKDIKGFMYALFSFPTRYIADYFFACSLSAGFSRFGRKVPLSPVFKVVNNAIEIRQFGFDPKRREEVRKFLGIGSRFVLGHVGRLDPLKNHAFLLKLFMQIYRKYPDSLLMVVGEGDERARIEEMIETYDLMDSVILLGARSDISDLLQAMDVFLFPSLLEGLGISLIEAQATGLPCIASSNVPQEAKITDLVEFLPLNGPLEAWIDSVIQKRDQTFRCDRLDTIKEHGFDVNTTAIELQEFYLDL